MNTLLTGLPLYPTSAAGCRTISRFITCLPASAENFTQHTGAGPGLRPCRGVRPGGWVILSRGERQAREAMNEGVKLHLAALSTSFKAYDYDWGARHSDVGKSDCPAAARSPRYPPTRIRHAALSANVLLDEFAFHQDSRAIWKALFPVISKPGLKLRVISTPNGKGNKFYELMTGQDDGWSRHSTDIYQAVADGYCAILKKSCAEARATLTCGHKNLSCNGWMALRPGWITT